jgi:DNA repair exonuclease SbcCD nuclease subunit
MTKDAPNWTHTFSLSSNMKLALHGINSTIISNGDDHTCAQGRKMYIGESQVPSIKDSVTTINMSLCHHPLDLWKFNESLMSKMSKRVDIQLYGHIHNQSTVMDDNAIILYSGAIHPVRKDFWKAQYNWISISCDENNEKHINIEIFPRKLSEDRHNFKPDRELVTEPNASIKHVIKIDQKRKANNNDNTVENNISCSVFPDKNENINVRELRYKFVALNYLEQLSILMKLELLEDGDSKSFPFNINKAINKAVSENKLDCMWTIVNGREAMKC